MKVILALDAGTTNVKAIVVDQQANVLARSSIPLSIDFPKIGWVEQSADAVWDAARQALEGCLVQGAGHEVVALGISNQRETRGPVHRLAMSSQRRNLSGAPPERFRGNHSG